MFLHLSLILFTGRGGIPDKDPPWPETPRGQKLPPLDRDPPVQSPLDRDSLHRDPCTDPPGQRSPARRPPPAQSPLDIDPLDKTPLR